MKTTDEIISELETIADTMESLRDFTKAKTIREACKRMRDLTKIAKFYHKEAENLLSAFRW